MSDHGPSLLYRTWVYLDSLSYQLGWAMAGKCLTRVIFPRNPGESATSRPEGTPEENSSNPDIAARRSEAGGVLDVWRK